MSTKSNGAGKGDRPRSNSSKSFGSNYDGITWGKKSLLQRIIAFLKNLLRITSLVLILSSISCVNLDNLEVKNETSGTINSSAPFAVKDHRTSATYKISETIYIQGKIADPYFSTHILDKGVTKYGETSFRLLF